MQSRGVLFTRLFLFALLIWLLTSSSVEFWNITWGTGEWLGQFSFKWALFCLAFILFCVLALIGARFALFDPNRLAGISRKILALRQRLGFAGWLFGFVILIFPAWFLQYTAWGIIMDGPYLRLLMWTVSAVLLG